MQGKASALYRPFRLSGIGAPAGWLAAVPVALLVLGVVAAIVYALVVLHSMQVGLADMSAKLSLTNRLLEATNHKLSITNSRLLASVELAGAGGQKLAVTNAQLGQMARSLSATNVQLDLMRRGLNAMESDFRRASATISHSALLRL